MGNKVFSSSCHFLLDLLSTAPSGIPDLRAYSHIIQEFRPYAAEAKTAEPEILASFAHRTLDHGAGSGGSFRLGLLFYRTVRARFLAERCYLDAQALDEKWRMLAPTWRGQSRRARSPASIVDQKKIGPQVGRVASFSALAAEIPREVNPKLLLTGSQSRCMDVLTARAELFFDPPQEALNGIPVQTNSLLLGPAGCGKTTLARTVSDTMNADFLHLSHGSWIVEGAQDSNSTVRIMLWRAAHNPRVVLFIDELDKLTLNQKAHSDWEVSLRNDLWLTLDRALSWGSWATKSDFTKHLPEAFRTAKALEHMFKTRVFIIAAGTWQSLHRPKPAVGFASQEGAAALDGEQLNRFGDLPEEMLRRFNRELVNVDYPSVAEIDDLVARDGLLRLAGEVGVAVDSQQLRLQMELVGMTALTTLKTNLLLRRRQQQVARAAAIAC